MFKKVLLSVVVLLLVPNLAWSVEVYREGDRSLDIGFWGQAWFQWVEDGKDKDGDDINDTDLNDFLVRRAYMSIKGSATPMLDFFVHYATDRAGQDGTTDNHRIQLRDGWMRVKLVDEAVMLNLGRMYVPITRTPSTKSLMMIDLDWTQGGVRGGSFYPSAAANRDDGAMLWGNLVDDKLRYRLMVADGEENDAINPDDNLRYMGQVSVSLMEPEKGYFSPQTYLGKKSVLSILASYDSQADLMLGGKEEDYTAWTAEVHWDQPMGDGGVTVEAAYIDIENGTKGINFTRMAAGDDATIISVKAGHIFPNGLQPVVHYEKLNIDDRNGTDVDGTDIYGIGLNYFVKGHANKLCLDVTKVVQEEETDDMKDHLVVTAQIAVGF